jgi:hypothetical protein
MNEIGVEKEGADAFGDKSGPLKKARDASVGIVFVEAEQLHPDVC